MHSSLLTNFNLDPSFLALKKTFILLGHHVSSETSSELWEILESSVKTHVIDFKSVHFNDVDVNMEVDNTHTVNSMDVDNHFESDGWEIRKKSLELYSILVVIRKGSRIHGLLSRFIYLSQY